VIWTQFSAPEERSNLPPGCAWHDLAWHDKAQGVPPNQELLPVQAAAVLQHMHSIHKGVLLSTVRRTPALPPANLPHLGLAD
jgi:hypothetical protein